jgi:Ni,Fe-hydrogenase III small subunit
VEEHFASHQDIRSQLNKIMKVGILSHSDDVHEEGATVTGVIENEEIVPHDMAIESPSPEHLIEGLLVRDSLKENLHEMA